MGKFKVTMKIGSKKLEKKPKDFSVAFVSVVATQKIVVTSKEQLLQPIDSVFISFYFIIFKTKSP